MLSAERDRVIELAKADKWDDMDYRDYRYLITICGIDIPKEIVKISEEVSGVVSETHFSKEIKYDRKSLIKLLKKILKERKVI